MARQWLDWFQHTERMIEMPTYEWRAGGPKPKVPAQVFGDLIENLAGDVQQATATTVVDAARNPRSPIHKLFVWDQDKAAEAYRRAQARHYLGSLQVVRVQVENGPTLSNRAYFITRRPERAYTSINKIMSDRDLKLQMIEGAKREIESYVNKYSGVLALGSFIPRLQEVIDEMRDEIDRLAVDATSRRGHSVASDPSVDAPATAPA